MWPDSFFGVSIKSCCDAHDMSEILLKDDLALMQCVSEAGPLFVPIGVIMFIGVVLFKRFFVRK